MRRIATITFLLLIALGACKAPSDLRAPFTDSRIPPGLEHRFYPPQGWAWGLIKVGTAPPVRYGVAAPASAARAQVIILPAEGEIAEAWFETVRDLNKHGFVVWVLEPAGQGGSGRYSLPRDVIHAPSLDPDVAALMMLGAQMVRSRPLFVISAGASAPVAARAAELNLGTDGMVLVDPVLPSASYQDLEWRSRLGLGALRAPAGMDDRDGLFYSAYPRQGDAQLRAVLTRFWQSVNPDFRLAAVSSGWYRAMAQESAAARASWPRISTPMLMVGHISPSAKRLCAASPSCSVGPDPIPSGLDAMAATPHQQFIAQLIGFIDGDHVGVAPAPAATTVWPES